MKDNIKKVWYYYCRNRETNEPLITVCLIAWKDGQFTRGMALCSDLDNPSKKIGRHIAYGRAVKLAENCKQGHRVVNEFSKINSNTLPAQKRLKTSMEWNKDVLGFIAVAKAAHNPEFFAPIEEKLISRLD